MKNLQLKKSPLWAVGGTLLALALLGCPSSSEDSKNGEAVITAVTVAGYAPAAVPDPVESLDWNDEEYNFTAAQLGTVEAVLASELTSAQVVVTASKGASLLYAKATSSARPKDNAFAESATLALEPNNFVTIKVTSEDGKAVNYYRLRVTTKSADNSLKTLTITSGETDIAVTDLGTPGASWNDADLVAGTVSLSNAQKTGVTVTGTGATGATIKYGKVTGSAEPAFAAALTGDLADAEYIYIEVTAANGVDKSVYKIEVQIGRNALLGSLSVGGEEVPVTQWGTPSAALDANIAAGILLFQTNPAGEAVVTAEGADSEAAVKWAKASGTTLPSAFGTSDVAFDTSGDFLYVEVTAANGILKNYYKIKVDLAKSVTIYYGQPEIPENVHNSPTPPDGFDASLWFTGDSDGTNTAAPEWLLLDRVGNDDATTAWRASPHTSARAKLLWDADGVYVYVEVKDSSKQTVSESYMSDSIELFIDENPATKGAYTTDGNQYRVGADGSASGDVALTKYRAWDLAANYNDFVGETGGWAAEFYAPFEFNDTYKKQDQTVIGLELQLNCNNSGSRDGVIVWNNSAYHANYSNSSDFGKATLDVNGHELLVNAELPVFSAQPKSATYNKAKSPTVVPLTVAVAVKDNGTLSYQWYSNTEASTTTGTAISGETGTSYTPSITTEGSTYYYVQVTNTIADNGDGGVKSRDASSAIATIEVVNIEHPVDQVTLLNGGVVLYKFTLPSGAKWSDYTAISADYQVDEANFAKSYAVYRIYGPYVDESLFRAEGNHFLITLGSDTNAPYIFHQDDNNSPAAFGGTAGTWFNVNVSFATRVPNSGFTHLPADDATGPFYFGLGLKPQNGGDDTAVTFLVKNITLVSSDGTKNVVAVDAGAFSPAFLGYGGSSVWALKVVADPAE